MSRRIIINDDYHYETINERLVRYVPPVVYPPTLTRALSPALVRTPSWNNLLDLNYDLRYNEPTLCRAAPLHLSSPYWHRTLRTGPGHFEDSVTQNVENDNGKVTTTYTTKVDNEGAESSVSNNVVESKVESNENDDISQNISLTESGSNQKGYRYNYTLDENVQHKRPTLTRSKSTTTISRAETTPNGSVSVSYVIENDDNHRRVQINQSTDNPTPLAAPLATLAPLAAPVAPLAAPVVAPLAPAPLALPNWYHYRSLHPHSRLRYWF
jgi:hypothetical protein